MKTRILLGAVGLSVAGLAGFWAMSDNGADSVYQPRETDPFAETSYEWKGASEYYMRIRADKSTGKVSPEAVEKARTEINKATHRAGDPIGIEWLNRGPDNVGGRTRAILVDPTNTQRLYAGGVSGGMYISEDGGGSWTRHEHFENTDMTSAIVASIERAPNGDLWVGTGSSFDASASGGLAWPGKGISISKDDGVTWTQIESTRPVGQNTKGETWHAVNRIRFNKSTSRVFACTQRGLLVSDDAGETWNNAIQVVGSDYTAPGHDVVVGDDGSVVAAVGGRVFRSPNGDIGSFEDVTVNGFVDAPNFPTGYLRTALAMAPSDNNYVYAITVDSDNELQGVYRSKDNGVNWTRFLERITANNYFLPLSQGGYDLALAVWPDDPEKVLLGGLQIWKYDGGLSRVANEFVPEFSPFYIHADKHYFHFSPDYNNDKTLYVTSDGGISKSDDGGVTFQTVNKGFQTSQFYSVAYTPGDWNFVMGGTQDNGTHIAMGDNPLDPNVSFEIFGNDGIDCQFSQIAPYLFVTSQRSLMIRYDATYANINGSLSRKELSAPDYTSGNFRADGGGPFHTTMTLWESSNDPASKDSIWFKNDGDTITLATGDDVKRIFEGSITASQTSATIIEGTVQVATGGKIVLSEDPQNPNTLIGEGTGTIEFTSDNTVKVEFSLDKAPTQNIPVSVIFENEFEANDVLDLFSGTAAIEFNHVLSSSMKHGDRVLVRDPIQSMIALSIRSDTTGNPSGIALARGPLKIVSGDLNWIEFVPMGQANSVEFTTDGNHAFVGSSSGQLTRLSNPERTVHPI